MCQGMGKFDGQKVVVVLMSNLEQVLIVDTHSQQHEGISPQ